MTTKSTISILLILLCIGLSSIPETLYAQNRHRGHHHVRVNHVYHSVVVRRANVRYAALPRWRSVVTVVPTNAVVIKTRRHPYYFHNGVYYSQQNSGYVVVRPAPGIRIRTLPIGHRPIVVNTHNYYYYYGTFYTKPINTEEYEVVDAPEGAIVDALPDGYEIKNVNGTEYYLLDGVYYAEVEDKSMEDGIGYEVVRI